MNAPAVGLQLPAAIGAEFGGGRLLAALIYPDGPHALIKMPKAIGDFAGEKLLEDYDTDVPGALSLIDGHANTKAFAAAGSKIAQRVLAIGDGTYIPAIDELGAMYCVAKPTAQETYIYGRNGINLHSLPPRLPYAFEPPKQTDLELFREGGAEAFETDDSYWSSTQYAGRSSSAWTQWFNYGSQRSWNKSTSGRVVVVRRLPL